MSGADENKTAVRSIDNLYFVGETRAETFQGAPSRISSWGALSIYLSRIQNARSILCMNFQLPALFLKNGLIASTIEYC